MAVNRWVPWIEPAVLMTGGTFSVTATATTIPGCTLTFTPNINCRCLIQVVADVSVAGGGASRLLIQPRLDGVALSGGPRLICPTTGFRETFTFQVTADLTGGAPHTLDLQASIDVTGTAFSLLGVTRLGPIITLPNLY